MIYKFYLILVFLHSTFCFGDFIEVPVKINGKKTTLILDTGASFSVLSEQFCKEAGINLNSFPKNDKLFQEKTDEVSLEIFEQKFKTSFYTNKNLNSLLKGRKSAGLLSFNDLRDNILYLNLDAGRAELIEKFPEDINSWTEREILNHRGMISFKTANEYFILDTGAMGTGFYVRKSLISKYKHLKMKKELWSNSFDLYNGAKINKISWVDQLNIGDLAIIDSPVSDQFIQTEFHDLKNYIGLFGMTRFEIIVDCKNNKLYTKSIKNPQSYYRDNYTGLCFKGNDSLTCVVKENSPAAMAGLKTGDVLIGMSLTDLLEKDISFEEQWKIQTVKVRRNGKELTFDVKPVAAFKQNVPKKELPKTTLVSKRKKAEFNTFTYDDLNRINKVCERELLEKSIQGKQLNEYETSLVFIAIKELLIKENIEVFNHLQNHNFGCLEDVRQSILAMCYLLGRGTEKNIETGLKYLKLAAQNNNVDAQLNLAKAYYNGAIKKDVAEAIKWLEKASEQKSAEALYLLGVIYAEDVNNQNRTKALMYFNQAAKEGHVKSQYELFYLLYHAQDIQKNIPEALKWLKKASEQNHPDAMYSLAVFYLKDTEKYDKDTILKLLNESASAGYVHAQFMLGRIYMKGALNEKLDNEKAYFWFQKAASQGHEEARNKAEFLKIFLKSK